MLNIQNRSGYDSNDETFGENRDIEQYSKGSEELKILIQNANNIDLKDIFKHYKINLNDVNKKIICPFKFHKRGRENSASFNFYPETNSFHCFGCKSSGAATNFVSLYENLSKKDAAKKIIDLFNNGEIVNQYLKEEENYIDKIDYIISISNISRELIFKNINLEKIEKVLKSFDEIYDKYKLNNDALKLVSEQIILKLKELD